MALVVLLLLVVGFACFTVETIRTRSLIAAGLAAWILTALLGAWPHG